jgi:hypothetical protein
MNCRIPVSSRIPDTENSRIFADWKICCASLLISLDFNHTGRKCFLFLKYH